MDRLPLFPRFCYSIRTWINRIWPCSLLFPCKTLDYDSPLATERFTQPELLDKSQRLIKICRELTPAQIASLMSISDKLAGLNAARFSEWQPKFTPDNARQALLAFKGDVYTGLQAQDFNEADFDFAQQHLRMLSGLAARCARSI